MIFAQEILAPCTVDATVSHLPIYVRLDVNKKSDSEFFLSVDHGNKTPVLFLNASAQHTSKSERALVDDLALITACADNLMAKGIDHFAIAVDNDGALHKMIAHRQNGQDAITRARPLFDLYENLASRAALVEIILTVEDLSPGGLDATDGIAIAQALYERGLKNIIATAGSKNFPPLFDRRVTRKKGELAQDFFSNEPGLASALWLLDKTKLGVSACAYLDDKDAAIEIAHQLGLQSLIEKA